MVIKILVKLGDKMKLVMWGTKTCPDCVRVLEYLKDTDVKYMYIELGDSIMNLKKFIRMRDKEELFDETKKVGDVGVPCFKLEDGTLTLDWESVKSKIEKSK